MGYKHLTLIVLTTVTCFSINAKTLPCYISNEILNNSSLSKVEKKCNDLVTQVNGETLDSWELPILYYKDPSPEDIIGGTSTPDETESIRNQLRKNLNIDWPLVNKCMESYPNHIGSVSAKSVVYSRIEKKHHGTYVNKSVKLIQFEGFTNEVSEPVEYNLMCVLR